MSNVTQRAQPPEPLNLSDVTPKTRGKPIRREMEKLLLRFSPWIKPMIAEAADREGISMNVWCGRVLAEAAKASREGFVSQPVDVNTDRMVPESESEYDPELPLRQAPQPQPYVPPGVLWPTSPSPTITGTGTSGQTTTGGSYIVTTDAPPVNPWTGKSDPLYSNSDAPWTIPDDDIPELT